MPPHSSNSLVHLHPVYYPTRHGEGEWAEEEDGEEAEEGEGAEEDGEAEEDREVTEEREEVDEGETGGRRLYLLLNNYILYKN